MLPGGGSTTDKWSKSASWLLYEELGVELNDMSVSKRVFKEGGSRTQLGGGGIM